MIHQLWYLYISAIHFCGQQTLEGTLLRAAHQGFDQPKRDVETFLRFPQATSAAAGLRFAHPPSKSMC